MNGLNPFSQTEKNVSINGCNSYLATVKSGVPQDLLPDLFLFPIYINDSNQAMNYHKVHHFADDTNTPHISKSVKKVNKYINIVFKNLSYGLNTHSPLLSLQF